METEDGARRWRPDDDRPPAPGAGADLPDGTAVVIATSGSTGEPKGVQLTAAALLASARASLDRIGADPAARWLCPLPTSHIAGLGVLVRSIVSGTAPVVVDRLDPAQRNLAVFGCGYASLVPAQLRRMLDAGAGLSAFGAILLGGAAIPSGLLAGARAAGAKVITTYGMSETCGGCVYNGMSPSTASSCAPPPTTGSRSPARSCSPATATAPTSPRRSSARTAGSPPRTWASSAPTAASP